MTLAEQMVNLANDYISGRTKLAVLDEFIHGHIDESLELDRTATPEALLFGFVQIRIYEMDNGLPEDELRSELTEYLTTHALLQPTARERATG